MPGGLVHILASPWSSAWPSAPAGTSQSQHCHTVQSCSVKPVMRKPWPSSAVTISPRLWFHS